MTSNHQGKSRQNRKRLSILPGSLQSQNRSSCTNRDGL